MFNRGARVTPLRFNFEAHSGLVKTTNAPSYTFAGVPFGTPNQHRMVVCSVMTTHATDVISATIGGVPATVVPTSFMTGIIYAKVPSGSSGAVVVNFSTTTNDCRIVPYSFNTKATGKLDSAVHTVTFSTIPIVLSNVQCSAGGVVISCFQGNDTGTVSGSWNGINSYIQSGSGTTDGARYNYGYVLPTESSSIRDFTYTRGSPQAYYSGIAVSFAFID